MCFVIPWLDHGILYHRLCPKTPWSSHGVTLRTLAMTPYLKYPTR
ncbi:MAG: hypothetical protein ACEY3D_04330 [Rickettsia sp.]